MKIAVDTTEAIQSITKLRKETDLLIQSLEKAIELTEKLIKR